MTGATRAVPWPAAGEGLTMSNADLHRRSADLFNHRDWAGFVADYAADCEYIDQARNSTAKGREQVQEFEQGWVTAFSDAQMTDAQVIDGGSQTVLLFTGSGTNDGPLGPLPATGRQVSMRFCEIREYNTDGKVVRGQLFYDQVTMLVQLGHMNPPEG
ncbi:ester cyclase [Pseudonocardia sp. Cha107L01]|uniref:ester cyclase n=1 Tax=Pseudonocardia sp. Cha107L01 TaxID=3457576 RepID=UPI00403E8101